MTRSIVKRGVVALALIGGLALGGCAGQSPFLALGPAATTPALPEIAAVASPALTKSALVQGKEAFRARAFGLAEAHFRRAVEETPTDREAWLGLAATHDELGRLDLADHDYKRIFSLGKASAEVLNNRGYSYLLRGDYGRARSDFLAARKLAPDNAFVAANLTLLEQRSAARI